MSHFTTNKITQNTLSYADIWQRAYNGIIRLYNKPDTDIKKNTHHFHYKINKNNPLLKDERTLTSYNVRERLSCYGAEFIGLPKNRTVLFLLNIGLIVEISISDAKVRLLDLFNRQEIYNNKFDVIKSTFQEIITSSDDIILKNKLSKIINKLSVSKNIEIMELDLSCDDKFYPVLIKDYQSSFEKSNLDTFKSLNEKIRPFVTNLFEQYFNRKVKITDIPHELYAGNIPLAEFYNRKPIDSCVIPCTNLNECLFEINEHSVSILSLNEFVYDLTNTELDYQYYNDIYVNNSRIEQININEISLKHNNIHLILGYSNAKSFVDNVNAQSLYKASSELEKINPPEKELTKDEFMAEMGKMYDWYLFSNRTLLKEINYRVESIEMKSSELGLDSNFNVV